jgi:hypothetical protein
MSNRNGIENKNIIRDDGIALPYEKQMNDDVRPFIRTTS